MLYECPDWSIDDNMYISPHTCHRHIPSNKGPYSTFSLERPSFF